MIGDLFLYNKTNCTLCDEFKSELDRMNITYHVIMIDDDPELLHRYGARVPVLEAGTTLICEGHCNTESLSNYLNSK